MRLQAQTMKGALSFKRQGRRSQYAVRKATEKFLTQASIGTCTLSTAMPCESQKPAHYSQSNSENLDGHGRCCLFLIAQRGFDYNRNNNAQTTDLPRDELGPTIGGTTVSTTTVHLPLHTQVLVQVSYMSVSEVAFELLGKKELFC